MEDSQGKLIGRTGADGKLTVPCAVPCRVSVTAAGFSERTFELTSDTTIRLEPAAATEKVTVTAYRAPLGSLESPVTTRLLTENALATTAAVTLDDQLRQLPGVELFRRSSSLVANPIVAGNQPARPGFDLGQPHAAYRRRCAAERSAGRMDSLAGSSRSWRSRTLS